MYDMTDKMAEQLDQKISHHLKQNTQLIDEVISKNSDIVKREFVFHSYRELDSVLYFTDGLVSNQTINDQILRPLMIYSSELKEKLDSVILSQNIADDIKKNILLNSSVNLIETYQEAMDGMLSGDTIMFIDHSDKALLISTKGWDTRSVSEPETETVIRGSRDGFTESLRTNTALIRRRIRDPHLKVEGMRIGDKSKTDIAIIYVDGVVKEGLVDEVKERLQSIKIDIILESGYIEEFIDDAPHSPFRTVQSTERPDRVASAIYEGRVAIVVDNTPFVLIVPTYFWQYLQASDDYYSNYWVGSFFRLIRYLAFVISLTLPSLYVMLGTFHQEMIPTPLALTIAAGREAVPFPILLEALMMEITFELIREAGLRMPKPIGQTVSIIGSLVIGQAAVQAGLVSPFMVIVVAVTGIASFAIPNYAASFSIRLVRFPLLIASGTLGLFGFSIIIVMMTIHAISLRSFGEPYTAPLFPFRPTDQKDILIRSPWWKMDKRPQMVQGDPKRQEENQIPQPTETNDADGTGQNKNKKQKQLRTWRKGQS